MLENSRVAERLAALQEGLSSVELLEVWAFESIAGTCTWRFMFSAPFGYTNRDVTKFLKYLDAAWKSSLVLCVVGNRMDRPHSVSWQTIGAEGRYRCACLYLSLLRGQLRLGVSGRSDISVYFCSARKYAIGEYNPNGGFWRAWFLYPKQQLRCKLTVVVSNNLSLEKWL